MSGGRLVVLDRSGRDVKRYSLPDGLVTLGSDPACDIRVMLPTVSEHHATVVVRANQTIVRNISDGETLVNGEPVSVAALKHGDTITLGDRSLRWEYDQPSAIRAVNNPPSLLVKDASKQRGRGRKRVSETATRKIDPAVHLMLEMNHRASMPGGGKQVAIVQPQRRDALDKDSTPRLLVKPHRPYSQGKRQRASTTPKQVQDLPEKTEEKSKRKSTTPKMTPKTSDLSTTKASMWIESRKSSPRNSTPRNVTPRVERAVVARRAVASARKVTPLRTVVLRRAITPNVRFESPRKTPAPKVAKIQAPLEIDHTKQAALMLMTGHTPKSKIFSPKPQSATLVVKKPSPVKGAKKSPQSAKKSIRSANNTPQSAIKNATKTSLNGRKSGRQSKLSVTNSDDTPKRLSNYTHQTNTTGRSSRSSRNESTMVLEISDNIDARQSRSSRNRSSQLPSPALPSPKKSALKDPSAKKTGRKTDSKIQFDLSNLDNYSHDSTDVMIVSNTTRDRSRRSNTSGSDTEMSLHYSDTSQNNSPSPSPRRSINSRSSRILGSVLGTTIEASTHEKSTLTPESPNPRKSLRGSLMVQKVLDTPDKRYSNRTTKSVSDANRTKTLSPRSPRRNVESYSIVDLVSIDSNVSRSSSVYNSVRSSITTFGTPRAGRKTRSTINPTLLGSSTPYIGKANSSTRSSRASKRKSSPIDDATVSLNQSSSPKRSKSLSTPVQRTANTSRRSASLCTPEDAKRPISVNSTRVSRASRRTLNDTVELLSPASDDSPVTSRRGSRLLDRSLSASKSKLSRLSSPKSQDSSPKSQYVSLQTSTLSSRASTRSPQASPKSPRNSAIYQQASARSSRASTKSPLVSPKSPRAGTKSPRTSKSKVASPRSNDKSRRSSRKDLSLNIHESPEGGTITPDNTLSPEEPSTPMLSIRSLLESSQTSFASQRSSRHSDLSQVFQKQGKVAANLKRKTIGALNPRSEPRRGRTGIKSKSLNFGVIRNALLRLSKDSSNTSDKTDEEAPRPNNEDTITPKSTVKLIQEAVKEKHSTAKKPQSKRSIIDNLNESDIVKQLFNSPVKRKLSQSMTEFSRKQSLELASAKKRSRKTIALTGRTPDVSFSDHTVALAPEEFVSPLNTPQNSPNVSSVKRLFTRSTPQKVSAEKAPKQPARTRKSVKNDLTNISGVKNVFARSPRNSLSNIRGVKDIFASPPANDLRRVSGVKALFKGKTPKNDLTDVRGVRNLYKPNSPKNDLRNVSGVKKTLRGSPRNDLKDVRGVKRLFTREKSKDGLNDLSGVEELFDTSINSDKTSRNVSANDIIFDQLVGKRAIKATYAKSFSARPIDKTKNKRSAKSLNVSFDLISNNVEDWLEKELQKRISKTDSLINPSSSKGRKSNITAKSKASKSSSTSNVARELQKLVTDTVEGQSSSTRQSRVRTSTIIKSIPDTIPERKSTLKDNTSANNRANVSKAKLPAKKIILHSTPMKGQTNITADASVLGRVSPIVADKTHALNVSRSIKAPLSPKPKPVVGTKRVTKSVVKPASPKSASSKKNVSASNIENSKNLSNKISPVKEVRKTRGRKTAAKTEITNTRKGRASLVITKKQPILSPQPPSPKLTRKGRRNANQEKAKITKTNTKTAAKKVASPKQSPKKVTKKAASPKKVTKKVETPKASPKKARTTRGKKLDDKPATPKINRTRVNKNSNLVIPKPSPQLKPQSKAKNNKTDIVFEEPKNKRGRRLPEKQISEDLAPRRGRAKKIESPTKSVEKPKRGRKATEKPEQTVKASTSLPAKRGRNAKTEDSVQETKTRGRKTQPSAEKPKRGRSTAAKDIDITKPSPAKGRKRKADVVVAEVKSTRQKKSEVKSDDKKGKTAKAQKAAPKPAERAKETAKKPEQTKPVRGKKAVEEAPKAKVTRGRKRKSDPEPANDNKKSPAKRARTTAQVKKSSPVKVKSPVKTVRTRRQKAEPTASTSTGRSRRK